MASLLPVGCRIPAMKNIKLFAFLFSLTCLLGCTLPTTPISQTGTSQSLTGNWQIQAGTAITSPPTAPYLVGAIEESGSTLTGVFATALPGSTSPTVEDYPVMYNATTGSVVLNSTLTLPNGLTIATLAVPTNPTTLSTGTLEVQCGLCNNGQFFPAVGVEIAPLNGTYTGTLSGTRITSSPTTTTPISGTASVTFTQSTTPNASGQFPVTGAVTFPSSSGMGTTTLPGLISGITIELSSEPCIIPFAGAVCNVVGPGSVLFAYTNPGATQITVTSLNGSDDTGTSVNLTGTLTLE